MSAVQPIKIEVLVNGKRHLVLEDGILTVGEYTYQGVTHTTVSMNADEVIYVRYESTAMIGKWELEEIPE